MGYGKWKIGKWEMGNGKWEIDQRSLMFNVDMRTKCHAHFSAAAASDYM
jgi:hypothetical protein